MFLLRSIYYLFLFVLIISCKKEVNYISDDSIIQLNLFNYDSTFFRTFEYYWLNPLQGDATKESIIIKNSNDYNKIFHFDSLKLYCLKPEVDFNKYYVIGIKSPELEMGSTIGKMFFSFDSKCQKNINSPEYALRINAYQFFENGDKIKDVDNIQLGYKILWYAFPKTADISNVIIDKNYKCDYRDITNVDLQSYCGTYKGYIKKFEGDYNGNIDCNCSTLNLKVFNGETLTYSYFESNEDPLFIMEFGGSVAGFTYAFKINNIVYFQGNRDNSSMFGNNYSSNYLDISGNVIVVEVECGIFYGKKI